MITPDRAADTAAAASGAATIVGASIGQINQYLQAAAYIVAMVSGICAAYYYIRKAHKKD